MGHVLNPTDQRWLDDLLLRLRLLQVPGTRIGEVLAEVQAHVAETGEHAQDAFGTPKEYAGHVAEAVGVTPGGVWARVGAGMSWRDLLAAVVSGLAGYLLATGLWALAAGEPSTVGLPTWLVCLTAALVLATCTARFVVHTRRGPSADPVVDPRDGADMAPWGPRQVALLAGVPVLMLLAMVAGGLVSR